jgi:hypothetical protein
MLKKVPPQSGQFIVYENLNAPGYHIVSADDMVTAVMRRVYGPASREACESFVNAIKHKPN